MKITQKKTKDLMATLSVEVKAIDYIEQVDKILKDYRKTAQIPGFRKGKTPIGIINRKPIKNETTNSIQNKFDDCVEHKR